MLITTLVLIYCFGFNKNTIYVYTILNIIQIKLNYIPIKGTQFCLFYSIPRGINKYKKRCDNDEYNSKFR